MFQRLWQAIRSWLCAGIDKIEDPEILLRMAQQEWINSVHAKNRERAVRAITSKNNLQKMLEQIEKRAQQAQRAALEAEGKEDVEAARKLRAEAEELRCTLEKSRQQLAEATAIAEEIKRNIRDEEMKIRQQMRQRIEERMMRLNSYNGRAIDLEMRRQLRAAGLWDDRQQVPPTEVTPRDMIVGLVAWGMFLLAILFVIASVKTR